MGRIKGLLKIQKVEGWFQPPQMRAKELGNCEDEQTRGLIWSILLRAANGKQAIWNIETAHKELQLLNLHYRRSGHSVLFRSFLNADRLLYTAGRRWTEHMNFVALQENVKPTAVAVDGAAQVAEPELWPVLAYYKLQAFILVGDQKQLCPIVLSSFQQRLFSPRMQGLLFARLHWNGLAGPMLNLQHHVSDLIPSRGHVYKDNVMCRG